VTCDLIIPARNEAANITALFDALDPLRQRGVVRQVVVADNGSTDGTAALATARGGIVVHEPQRGYGAACLKAIDWIRRQDAPPDVVAFIDADLSDDPALLPDLLRPIEVGGADMVIGSRARLAEPGALTAAQRLGNNFACTLMRLTTGRRHRDLGPFRAIRWETLARLAMADRTWGWTVEMQMKAAMLDVPVVEVDVPYRRRRAGTSTISGTVRGVLAAGTRIILTIALLWLARTGFPPARE
jgi:glycosyltransferase involved in cell wall biosynthesis